jgi:hypothetical protein
LNSRDRVAILADLEEGAPAIEVGAGLPVVGAHEPWRRHTDDDHDDGAEKALMRGSHRR